MRSPVNDLQVMHYAEHVKLNTTSENEDIMGYGEPVEFMAVANVPSGQVVAALYGSKLPYVRALTTNSVRLREEMGVWVDAPTTGDPDYKVISDRSTSRQYACDIGKRGQFGG